LLATIETPTLVLWGGTSHPAVQRANELVGECIPNASVATIDGAAHFLITTHASQVANVLAEHVARVERMSKLAASFSS
jgi:pimeloyl-ACP methyl ester carboxylesterase